MRWQPSSPPPVGGCECLPHPRLEEAGGTCGVLCGSRPTVVQPMEAQGRHALRRPPYGSTPALTNSCCVLFVLPTMAQTAPIATTAHGSGTCADKCPSYPQCRYVVAAPLTCALGIRAWAGRAAVPHYLSTTPAEGGRGGRRGMAGSHTATPARSFACRGLGGSRRHRQLTTSPKQLERKKENRQRPPTSEEVASPSPPTSPPRTWEVSLPPTPTKEHSRWRAAPTARSCSRSSVVTRRMNSINGASTLPPPLLAPTLHNCRLLSLPSLAPPLLPQRHRPNPSLLPSILHPRHRPNPSAHVHVNHIRCLHVHCRLRWVVQPKRACPVRLDDLPTAHALERLRLDARHRRPTVGAHPL